MSFIAGVDCHKSTHSIVFLDSVGKVVGELVIPATSAGYEHAMAAARALGATVTWGLEGSGTYGRPFATALILAGMVVFEVPGVFTKRHRKGGSGNHTLSKQGWGHFDYRWPGAF